VTGDHGSRTFNNGATLAAAGSHTISVADGPHGGTSGTIVVSAGAFSQLLVVLPGQTSAPGAPTGRVGTATNQPAHTSFTITVLSVDAWWNPVTSTDTVAITSSDPVAVQPPNSALAAGSQTFSVTLETPGTATVTATDATDGSKTANTSSTITVTNTAPSATNDAYAVIQDNSAGIAAPGVLSNDTDAESQALSVGTPRPVSGPAHGSLTLNADGSFMYTPNAGYSGSDSFTYGATDGFLASAAATVTLTVQPTAYVPSSPWLSSFDPGRSLALTFPDYVPAGSNVYGATFTHTYRSNDGVGTTCYYFETYQNNTLLATHGGAGSPVSCAGGSWVTDTISLPEVDSAAKANHLTIVLYVENSAGGYSAHRLATVAFDYDLP
jgi:VCBS repeat-containing protein